LRSPNIPQLSGVRLHSLISSRYKKPVVIENDANAAALGEKWKGSGAAFQSFVLFTLGTGIGGGMVIGSELVPVAAEIGHMTINAEGLRCSCGNKGCLETVASATAIVSKTVADMERGAPTLLKERHSWNFSAVRAEDVYKAAKDGDALCQKVLREAGQGLGIGIANAINLMSPDAVILTGGLASAQDFYVEEAIREAAKRALPELYEKSEIIPSALEGDAGIFGAARLAFINSA
jgi:glucokinase